MERSGTEWNGVERSGTEWNGVERKLGPFGPQLSGTIRGYAPYCVVFIKGQGPFIKG